jgi:hypothetical protein
MQTRLRRAHPRDPAEAHRTETLGRLQPGGRMSAETIEYGIRQNLGQFLHLIFQVLLVGMTIGMMRTVVPALAESKFGIPKDSFALLVSFVVSFGFIKGALNLVSWRERRFFAICQAGLIEKFIDALIWVFYPVFLYGKDISLPGIGWVVGVGVGVGVAMMLLGEGTAWWSARKPIRD